MIKLIIEKEQFSLFQNTHSDLETTKMLSLTEEFSLTLNDLKSIILSLNIYEIIKMFHICRDIWRLTSFLAAYLW